ncbi:XRE family transcriptional regulator [Rhodococcus rhodochrous]|uniref:Cro/Cl family transcriptional regulator n=1 Tax=Rhodococcus rhodochrous KG-21 TaxID=1441923 RepID=A0A0M8PI91_RHORH|nr:XRE family transcriptional regulator [Rhodococcus rhodochrous]KOS56866.1 Cro/Cl family transcriptional regulator [Rhodococcus rhodochrous KG-21]
MAVGFGDFVRIRRGILGLSQRELAERSGIKQPLIAAIETGRRHPSEPARSALTAALPVRPSEALAARRGEVCELFAEAGLPNPRVFGSVARGDDDFASDVDLIVDFSDRHDIVDLLGLQQALEDMLTVRVEIVDGRAGGRVGDRARKEAVAL